MLHAAHGSGAVVGEEAAAAVDGELVLPERFPTPISPIPCLRVNKLIINCMFVMYICVYILHGYACECG